MAVITRTPTGIVTPDGTLPYAQTDTPNVGGAVISGAPAATLTNPVAAASQPPPVPAVGGGPATTGIPVPPASTTPSATRPAVRGPASGVSPAVDDALLRAKADAQVQQANDQLSPTTMVLNYLQKQGLPRTSENVRRALEANARDSSTIPGLVNEAPPAATAVDTRPNAGGGGGGNRPLPVPPIPPTTTSTAPATSTGTTGGGLSAGDIASLALTGLAGAGGAYGLYRYLNRGPGGDATTPVGPDETIAERAGRADVSPSGRVIDVNPEGLPAPNRPAVTDQSRTTSASPSASTKPDTAPTGGDDTTSRAITRATEPDTTTKIDVPQYVSAEDVKAAIRNGRIALPPGVTEQDLADMANRTGSQRLIFGGARSADTAAQARVLSEAAAARAAARAGRLFRRP